MSERGFEAKPTHESTSPEPWIPAGALHIEKDALLQAITEIDKPKLVDISIKCGVGLADLLETLYQFERTGSLDVAGVLAQLEDGNQKATKSYNVYKRIRVVLEELRAEKRRAGSEEYTIAELAQKLNMKPSALNSHIKGIGADDFLEFSGKGF